MFVIVENARLWIGDGISFKLKDKCVCLFRGNVCESVAACACAFRCVHATSFLVSRMVLRM